MSNCISFALTVFILTLTFVFIIILLGNSLTDEAIKIIEQAIYNLILKLEN